MFEISDKPIDTSAWQAKLNDLRAGAMATFEGRVRNHNEGHDVVALEYEAYGVLAVKEGERILEEAKEKFDVLECVCIHRTGKLELGDIAVWVGAIAAHRDAAFRATRYIIDEVKARVPIWKKEHYGDGHTDWVNCAHPADVGSAHPCRPFADNAMFDRQMLLPQIGSVGQTRLAQARVLIVGAGGLGCPAALYLAAAGIGTLAICDSDKVDVSNLHRQVLFGPEHLDRPKASSAAAVLSAQYPGTRVVALDERVDANSVHSLIRDYDVVLDCTDNFESKFLLSDACRSAAKTVIQASVYQFEGQLTASFSDGSGQFLRDLWGETPEAGCVGSCTESGVIGATVGVFGSLQAMEAIKVICGIVSELRTHIVLFDLLSLSTRKIKVKTQKSDAAPNAGESADNVPEWRLDALSLSSAELRRFELIDIREANEDSPKLLESLLHKSVVRIPLSTLDVDNPRLSADKQYLFICQRGMRSDNLVAQLRARGFNNAFSLAGGVEAVRRKFIA